MKKNVLLAFAMLVFVSLQAQWVDDPVNNNFIANSSADASELYLSTDPVSGDTYLQWASFGSNGWSPSLQRLNVAGEPQWGSDGIRIEAHEFATWSAGTGLAATTDNAVVSCFSTAEGKSYAVKINADGTYAWGEQGVMLFDGGGGSRTEIVAGDDGGVWTLGSDYSNLLLQYVNADGSLNPLVIISAEDGYDCMYGMLTLSHNNHVFVTYERIGSGSYMVEKQIWVEGYAPDGSQFTPDTQLMGSQTVGMTYSHYAIPDGAGGGYVYLWHNGVDYAFNVYVFHFDDNGENTFPDLSGVTVHSHNPNMFFLDSYATADPESHDMLIAYRETDAATESMQRLYVNRITPDGEVLWGDGMLVFDNGNIPFGGTRIDAFENGGGFTVINHMGVDIYGYESTVEAIGYDMEQNTLWTTQMCTNVYAKAGDRNSTGFHQGQNIVAWVNSDAGGVYGQNIGQNGEMGEIELPCYPPTDFQGEASYDPSTQIGAAVLSWTAPESQPIHYNLYCEESREVIEIDGQYDSYSLEREPGEYIFRLTSVYEDCESDYALTPDGEDFVVVEIIDYESVIENEYEEIVTITAIYNLSGQKYNTVDLDALSRGLYIVQGMTQSGKMVSRKMMLGK